MSSKRPPSLKRAIVPAKRFGQSWLDECDRTQRQPSSTVLGWFDLLHTWDFIAAKATEGKPRWRTDSKHPLCAKTLYLRWQCPDEIIGVRFNTRIRGTTQYGLIDIDVGSSYHPYQDEAAFWRILTALEVVGLCRYIIIRSSHSEGLHIYFPLPKAVSCNKLALVLQQTVRQSGYAIAAGQLELFPNVRTQRRTLYQGHRLPLQLGSYVLDKSFQPVHNSIDKFVETWNQIADHQDIAKLEEAIANAKPDFYRGSSKELEEWRIRLEASLAKGWTAHGQTNHIVKDVCVYARVFEELAWDDIVPWAVKTVAALPGYNQFCQHQHEIRRRVRDWVKLLKKEGRYHPCSTARKAQQKPKGLKNDERKIDARTRIEAAIAQIESEQGELPRTVRERQQVISATARCSIATLRKHLELWHPDHTDKGCVPADAISVSAIFEQGSKLHQNAHESEIHLQGDRNVAALDDSDVEVGISDLLPCVPANVATVSVIFEQGLESKQRDTASRGCVPADAVRVSAIFRQGDQTEEITEIQSESSDTHPTLLSVSRADRGFSLKPSPKTSFSSSDQPAARREEIFSEGIRANSIVRHRMSRKVFRVKRVNPDQTVWASYMFEMVPLVDAIFHISELESISFNELQAMTDKAI